MKTRSSLCSVFLSSVLTNIKKIRTNRLFFFILFSVPAFQPASGLAGAQTTYYISASGSNTINGTSSGTSWATIGKINSFSNFQPGDSILLKGGDVFEGQIYLALHGTPEAPIVIGAYYDGTDDKPLIYGDMRGVTWTPMAGRTGYYKAYIGGYSWISQYFYQWRNGAWLKSSGIKYRDVNKTTWTAFYDALAEGQFATNSGVTGQGHDTLFLHTFGSVTFPATRDSMRVYRHTNLLLDGSHDVIVRDLDIHNFVIGIQTETVDKNIIGFSNIIFRNLNTTNCGIRMTSTTDGVIDSCRIDTTSTSGTALYLIENTRTKVRYNTITNVVSTVDGIPRVISDACGIGIQGSFANAFNWSGVGYNTIEYNTLHNIYNGFIDFWWNIGDTVRYNIGHGGRSGGTPSGTNIVMTHNNFTFFPAGGNGTTLSQTANGNITYAYNTLDSIGNNRGIWVYKNDSAGTITINNNTIRGVTNCFVNFEQVARITSKDNAFYGNGYFANDLNVGNPVFTRSLSSFQSTTGYEAGSVWNSGSGSPTGALTVTPSSLSFGNVFVNTTSSERTYTVQGSDLSPASGSVTITAPSGHQVSVTSGSGFGSSLNVSYTGSTLSSRTIYVRFSPTAVQSYNGNITNSGGNATTKIVAISSSGVNAPILTLIANPPSMSFGNVIINTISSEQTYMVAGMNLLPAIDSVTITAPSGFTISTLSGSGFTSPKRIAYTDGTLTPKTIYIRFSPTAAQSYSGSITNVGGGATQNVAVTGTGISSASPVITINPGSLAFSTVCINTTSSEQTYTVQGSNLSPASGSITIAPPSGYQVSVTSDSGFGSSLNISYTDSTLSLSTIYIRFSPTAVQSYSDSITNVGGGATTKNVFVSGNGLSDLPPPTGTFIASSDTLPASGGSVTLTWTSSNASSASINNGIGTVATNGSITRTIRSTTRFILTLSNINGNTLYVKKVYVRPRKLSYNKALNMPSTASSVELTGVEANKANDGNASTRWSSISIDNQWWQVDLQDISTIDNVALTWENSYASQFTISTSLDGLIFTDVVTGYASGPDTMELNFDPVNARYVRLTSIERGTQWGISFFELGAYESLTTSAEPTLEVPRNFLLEQNFPNPFNPSTEIGYQLNTTAEVQLIVYDILGKEITVLVNQVQRAGRHSVTFNANNLASGIYYAKLQAEEKVQIRKMMLMK